MCGVHLYLKLDKTRVRQGRLRTDGTEFLALRLQDKFRKRRLYDVRSIETVHTVDAENAFLFRQHSDANVPVCVKAIDDMYVPSIEILVCTDI